MSSFETLSAIQAAIEAHAKQPELLETIAQLDAQIKSTNASLEMRDATITGLNDQIATLKTEMEALKSQLEAAEFRELERTEERDQALDKLNQIFGIAKVAQTEVPVPLEVASNGTETKVPAADTVVSGESASADPFASGPVPSMLSPAVQQPAEPAAKPYTNVSWYDAPYGVSYSEWVAQGGQEYMDSNGGSAARRRY